MHDVEPDLTGEPEKRPQAADEDHRGERIDSAFHAHIRLKRLGVTPDIEVLERAVLEEMEMDAFLHRLAAHVGVIGSEQVYLVAESRHARRNRFDEWRGYVALVFGVG